MPKEVLIKNLLLYLPSFYFQVILKRVFLIFTLKKNLFVAKIFKIFSFLRFFLLRQLVDIVGIDFLLSSNRFGIIYNSLSLRRYIRIFVQLFTTEASLKNEVENKISNFSTVLGFYSLSNSAYKNYGWLEREVWDMFGIFFFNNYDLRRILTDYGFEGFPLRKDFPLTGFLELRYDDEVKSVIYEDLELTQEFRFFDFESPWKRKYVLK